MSYPVPADCRYLTANFIPFVPEAITDRVVWDYLTTLRAELIRQSVTISSTAATASSLDQLWISAGAMRGSIQGASVPYCSILTQIPQGTATAPDLITLDFDPATQEHAEFSFALPPEYAGGTFTYTPYWSHAATTTNFGVTWGMVAGSAGDGENMDAAPGTEVLASDTGGSTGYLYNQSTSGAVTIAGSPVAGNLAFFRVFRKPSHGSDTMAIDARLHGVLLDFS